MQEFINDIGSMPLSELLKQKIPQIGYGTFHRLLRKGDIKINGIRTRDNVVSNKNDRINVYYVEKKQQFCPTIVYEDANIAIFYKPIKMASQGDNSFEQRVKSSLGENYILCHRLDTNTDGLLIFAKSESVFEQIKADFKANRIEKKYLAMVFGRIEGEQTLSDYLVKDAKNGLVRVYKTPIVGAKRIITEIRPIGYGEDTTCLEVGLVTGRTHQIRAHLASIGHPIIGDGKYGRESLNRRFNAKVQMLCAYKVTFKTDSGVLAGLNNKSFEIDARDRFLK